MARTPSREPTSVRKCPICDKPRDPKYNPFCSRRCADVDLGRWLKGNYVIAGDERSDKVRPSDEDE